MQLLWSGMLLYYISASYRLRATAELPETVYSMAVENTTSMEWQSPHMIAAMLQVVTVHEAIIADGGTTPAGMCSLLNGPYCHDTSWQGVHLLTFTGYSHSLTFVEMKLTARLVKINSYYATMVTLILTIIISCFHT